MYLLRFGTPPALEDCTDIGTVSEAMTPKTFQNEGIYAGSTEVINLMGVPIPENQRAWEVVTKFRRDPSIPKPYLVRIPDLGTLLYAGECSGVEGDNWGVIPFDNKE